MGAVFCIEASRLARNGPDWHTLLEFCRLVDTLMNSGIRVTLDGRLSRAAVRPHVDVNIGNPIWPEPQYVSLPRLLDGALQVRGYPLEMVLARGSTISCSQGTKCSISKVRASKSSIMWS